MVNFLWKILPLLAIFGLILIEKSSCLNTVGKPCSNDTECEGPFEECSISDNIDPPCTAGFCACQHCYSLPNNLADCTPTIYKTLNDPCSDFEPGNVILPRNAHCYNNVVLCRQHHAFINGHCLRIEKNGDYGQPCGQKDPCDYGLICGARFSECICPDQYKKWDADIGKCIPRQVGDFCYSDDDCQAAVSAFVSESSAGSMVCTNGFCKCSTGLLEVPASFISDRGQLELRTVCQGPGSRSNIGKSIKCSSRAGNFLGAPYNTCDTALTCVQCPEDIRRDGFTSLDGICRAMGPPDFKPLCPGQVPDRGTRRPIEKAGSYGNICTSNAECTGDNELCVRTVNIDPPCQQGTCGCLPGFVADPELGYLCVIVIKRKIGEQCNVDAETPGVAYPENAYCKNGTITCKARHNVDRKGDCERVNFDGWIDSACTADVDCETPLGCYSGRCTCASAYKWVALGEGYCAHKVIGDACGSHDDCASASAGGASAQCIKNMCGCPDDTKLVLISEFDPKSDTYIKSRSVCVSGSATNQSAGAACHLDRSGLLCRSPLVCYKCIEDQFEIGQGICRNVRSSALIPTLPPTPVLAVQYNSVGKICRRNNECSRNEMCVIAKFIDPPCVYGVCQCRPCYSISSVSSQCELATYHIVGDTCTVGEVGTFFPPNSECNNGVVLCKPHYSPSLTGSCVRSMLNGYFGAPCKTRADCDNGLSCGYVTKKCTCPQSYMRWDSARERCVKREFGDACSADGDCAVRGNMAEGYTYYGGACSAQDGTCVCKFMYLQTSASFVDLALGQYSKRTICVNHPSILNVAKGGTCQTDPVYNSDSRIYVCSENSICYSCPEDNRLNRATSNIGRCRSLIDVPPSPQCFPWLPTTPNITTTTVATTTFRLITTTTTTTTTTEKMKPVFKVSKVGYVCFNETECGYNEECAYASTDPPCLKGICQCKPCHAQDDFTRLCMPQMEFFLGEGCSSSSLEVYPPNAECRAGVVTCKACYNQQSSTCVKKGNQQPGQSCESVCDCAGNMFCNQETFVCECFHLYEKWVDSLGKCIKREFGDTCNQDVECDVFGAKDEGYTYSGGQCLSLRCACEPGYSRVLTGFVANQQTGAMGEKAICVTNTSLLFTDRQIGDRCNLDPIWFSAETDALSSGVCGSSKYCYQCPDDATASGNDGKCRVATPKPAQQQCVFQRPLRALPPPTPPATPIVTNTVGYPCSRDAECSENEVCVVLSVDPPCKKGFCECKSCHAIGVNGMCSQYIQLAYADYCDSMPNELYPPYTSCQLGVVCCDPCYIDQDGICVRATALRPYGARCISDCDCDGEGTYCEPDSGTCMCRQYYEKWDAVNQRCLRREYGDVCVNDAQCNVRGQSGLGYTYSGGACINGQCTCDTRYMATDTSFFRTNNATFNSVLTKTLCVRDGIEVNRTKGMACAVDPIYNSDDVISSLGSCQSSTFCFQCADDLELPNFRRTDGLCRSRTGFQPLNPSSVTPIKPQDCFAIYRQNNSIVTLGPPIGRSPPPRIAGTSQDTVCATKGLITDMLLEHVENQPFGSFQIGIMRSCISRTDCPANEACVIPSNQNDGFCHCQPPNFIAWDGSCKTVASMPTASSRTPTTWVRIRIGG